MQRTNPWQSYRKVATQTASPGQLVLMLYEGAIRFSEQALAGFEHQGRDPLAFNQTVSNNLNRAHAIVAELNGVLNMRQGGDVAQNFRRLYNYLGKRLLEANIRKQKEPIQEVIMRLRVLRDSWAQMLQQGAGNAGQTENAELQTA